MISKTILRVCIFFFMILNILSCKHETEYILNENFNKNTLGWIEEHSDFHSLNVDSGYYFIHSKDTTQKIFRTSTTCLDLSHLINLPEEYEIETRIKLMEYETDEVIYGLILSGATIEYSINLYLSGKVEVLEYNYNSRRETELISATSNYSMDENEISIKLAINRERFILLVNNYVIDQSVFSVKSWQDLRIFTSKQSKIAVDFLTIKQLTLESVNNS